MLHKNVFDLFSLSLLSEAILFSSNKNAPKIKKNQYLTWKLPASHTNFRLEKYRLMVGPMLLKGCASSSKILKH